MTPKYLSDVSAAALLCLALCTAFKFPWLASRPLKTRKIWTIAEFSIAPLVGPGIEEGPHSGLNFEEGDGRTAGEQACVVAGNCRCSCPAAFAMHEQQH